MDFCRAVDGFAHAVVGATTANICDVAIDVFISWVGNPLQQSGGSHHESRLTVSTLLHDFFYPGLLNCMKGISLRETLDGDDGQ